MSNVLVVGSLHWDVVVSAPMIPGIDETLIADKVHYRLGGKGANQAVAAARMGADVAMAGRVGSDHFAELLLAGLDEAGVERSRVTRAEGDSGMSVAIVDAEGDYTAAVVSGVNREFEPDETLFAGNPALVCLQNEIPDSVNRAVAALARDAGVRVILNAAPARATETRLLELVDVLVVNRVEAYGLTGEERPYRAASRLARLTDSTVILTLGGDGLFLLDGAGKPVHHPAFEVPVVSTHGAGDMFVGALATELARGASVKDSLPVAQAAAALLVSAYEEERGAVSRDAAVEFAARNSKNQAIR